MDTLVAWILYTCNLRFWASYNAIFHATLAFIAQLAITIRSSPLA